MKGKKKYSNGTGRPGVTRNYIESPSEANIKHTLAAHKRKADAASDPWVIGTAMGGQIATGLAGKMNPAVGQIAGIGNGLIQANDQAGWFEMGGMVNDVPVEVEGGETAETPNGNFLQFQGPSHSEGGIDINLPSGTTINSDKIKIDGVSMADRKKKRKKAEMSLTSLLEMDQTDKINKNTLERTQRNNQLEEQDDLAVQEIVKNVKEKNEGLNNENEYALGTGFAGLMGNFNNLTGDAGLSSIIPMSTGGDSLVPGDAFGKTQSKPGFGQQLKRVFDKVTSGLGGGEGGKSGGVLGGMTGGDVLGTAGTLFSAITPLLNTEKQRAGDTPNINAFKDFGTDALNTNDEAKSLFKLSKDNQLGDLETRTRSNQIKARGSARGVNQMRAMDLANFAAANNQEGAINEAFNRNLANNMSQESQMQNVRDRFVMQGEQNRDLADRQDRDNYYTQKGRDLATLGQGIQMTGKNFNQIKGNKDNAAFLEKLKADGVEANTIAEIQKYFSL